MMSACALGALEHVNGAVSGLHWSLKNQNPLKLKMSFLAPQHTSPSVVNSRPTVAY